jgi:hypothetical protein
MTIDITHASSHRAGLIMRPAAQIIAARIESARNFCLKQPEKVFAFYYGNLRNQNLEVVYTRVIDFADLIKRVVSFESMLKRAKSLRHSKMAQKPVFPGYPALTRGAGPISR